MSLLKFYYPPADSPNPQRRYTSFEDYMTRYDPDGLKKWADARLNGSPQLVYQPTPQGWSELTDEQITLYKAQLNQLSQQEYRDLIQGVFHPERNDAD